MNYVSFSNKDRINEQKIMDEQLKVARFHVFRVLLQIRHELYKTGIKKKKKNGVLQKSNAMQIKMIS